MENTPNTDIDKNHAHSSSTERSRRDVIKAAIVATLFTAAGAGRVAEMMHSEQDPKVVHIETPDEVPLPVAETTPIEAAMPSSNPIEVEASRNWQPEAMEALQGFVGNINTAAVGIGENSDAFFDLIKHIDLQEVNIPELENILSNEAYGASLSYENFPDNSWSINFGYPNPSGNIVPHPRGTISVFGDERGVIGERMTVFAAPLPASRLHDIYNLPANSMLGDTSTFETGKDKNGRASHIETVEIYITGESSSVGLSVKESVANSENAEDFKSAEYDIVSLHRHAFQILGTKSAQDVLFLSEVPATHIYPE